MKNLDQETCEKTVDELPPEEKEALRAVAKETCLSGLCLMDEMGRFAVENKLTRVYPLLKMWEEESEKIANEAPGAMNIIEFVVSSCRLFPLLVVEGALHGIELPKSLLEAADRYQKVRSQCNSAVETILLRRN